MNESGKKPVRHRQDHVSDRRRVQVLVCWLLYIGRVLRLIILLEKKFTTFSHEKVVCSAYCEEKICLGLIIHSMSCM
jgi:hypothetical protein